METLIPEGRARVAIEGVSPEIDGGRFPIKRIVGDTVTVAVDVIADGHESIRCWLLFRRAGDKSWQEVAMTALVNDRWQASFRVEEVGEYRYTLGACIDRFGTWVREFRKRVEAGEESSRLRVEVASGAGLVANAGALARGADADTLKRIAERLRRAGEIESELPAAVETALSAELGALMACYGERRFATSYSQELRVIVERPRARFGSWYEMFPRSCAAEPGHHGTFEDCEKQLDYVASMGFDVLYLPPIHPIGRSHRKGRNNSNQASPEDPGSPWAIGAAEGGHKAVHPELGDMADFRRFRQKAAERGLEIALDLAFQCSPDHPYVREHPEWFRKRSDGTIRYAENPPKKYQDIYPLDFETDDWGALWEELESVVRFWIAEGIRIFRVDNPHTKPFAFWEWLIERIRHDHPEVIFLSEAFTRPKVMNRLAKLGFSQSYTYFTWRNTKAEITAYFTELTRGGLAEFFRPHLWPNTPDILPEFLQLGGRPGFACRLVLAATLGANYGIYGPAFELCENQPLGRGREDYLDSEKYEIRQHAIDRPDSLRSLITRMNRVRRENPALQNDGTLEFHEVSHDRLIAYSKTSPRLNPSAQRLSKNAATVANTLASPFEKGGLRGISPNDPHQNPPLPPFSKGGERCSREDRQPPQEEDQGSGNVILTVANLDPHHKHGGWVVLPLEKLGLDPAHPYQVHDLVSDARYLWSGPRNYVEIDPQVMPAHVFRLRLRIRTERDFDYFL